MSRVSIIGHESQIKMLGHAVASGKIPNAYLFHGPKSIGKRLVANRIAMTIVCHSPNKASLIPCNVCAGCKKSVSLTHPDIFIVEPIEGSILIDAIRGLKSKIMFHPMESSRKIVIIDDADKMLKPAANALLKLLEEPPKDTHIILVSSYPHKLLPTIRSRCQSVIFQPIDESTIKSKLVSIRMMDEKQAMRIAKLVNGRFGLALTLDEDFLDVILRKFMLIIAKPTSADIIEMAFGMSKETPDKMLLFLDMLSWWYRDVIYYKATSDEGGILYHEALDALKDISEREALDRLNSIENARQELDRKMNKQLMFESLLFNLTT